MVDAELTPEHEAFLAANGYAAEPPIRGDRQFVMRVFVPTEEGKPPIIAFRGTVANPLHPSATFHTLAADADPRGIGVYQLTPEENRKAINDTVQRVSDQYGPVVFAGHSLGGALAQTVASRFPGQADRIVTFQAPGVPHETAQSLEHYNAANPDRPVTSSHHRVAGDFVPTGGEALTPGTVHNHEMPDAGLLGKHTSYPLGREETAAGNDVPFHKGKDTRPIGDETTEHANSTKDLGKERARTRAGAVLYGPGLGLHRLFGGSREPQLPGTAPHELPPGTHEPGASDALPPAPRAGEHDDATAAPEHEPASLPPPLQDREAVIEQLAHGMVDGDLTPQDEAFLAANGYRTEPPISGPHQFVMRVFYPTEEGKPPIVAFRGTVPKKLATVGADLDPRSIGMWQYNANEAAIRDAVERASRYGKIVFSGHSLGGALAQTAASRFPDKAGSIVTFQAPGVSRDIVGSVEDYNAAHPENPVLSSHHRVTGDLVPKGGRAVTPGTIHNHEMEGGNALSRHLAYPLGREQVEEGNDVPHAKGGAMHHTGDESAERANATKNQTLENVRKGVGAVFYGPGLTIKGIANGVKSGVNGIKKLFHRSGDRAALPGTEHPMPGVRIHQPDSDDQTAANDALPPAPHPEDAGHDAGHDVERTDTSSDVSPAMPRPLPPVESQQAVEVAAIFVRNAATDRVEHSEVVDGTGLAPQDLADRIQARMTELGQRYASQRYEVYWEGFSSLPAMHRTHPDLG
jgi:pimeloyl-ACP methyl ester carboxylesterase